MQIFTAFAGVSEFWDKDLEYFEALTTAESQLILADNHHFENNDLFVIDEKTFFSSLKKKNEIRTRM